MKPRPICLLALAVAALAGCGGGTSHTTSTEPAGTTISGVRVAQVFVVHETEYKLSPSKILIPRLGYYAFKAVNDGKATHALELLGPGLKKTTKSIAPDDSMTFAAFFKRTANYKLFDPLDGNRSKGMQAAVRVP